MMSSKFRVEVTDSGTRAAKRITFNSEALKSVKLSTGDVIAISGTGTVEVSNDPIAWYLTYINGQKYSIGVAWPALEVASDGETNKNLPMFSSDLVAVVLVSSSLLLTANLKLGQEVTIRRVSASQSGSAANLPSLENAQSAAAIKVKELNPTIMKGGEKKARDWLALLLREHLGSSGVLLSYVTHGDYRALQWI
jgi:hypothetical protein